MALDRETKSFAYIFAALGVCMAGALAMTYKEDTAKTAMSSAFSAAANDTVFSLEGAHAVTANYEGRRYTYNFDNQSVIGGNTEHVGFGGGGYGGMQSFDNFEDQAAIATAKAKGCAIAAQAVQAENPGWPVTDDFTAAQRKAAQFTAKYCR